MRKPPPKLQKTETRSSSVFTDITYKDGILTVYLINNTIYEYRQVPPVMWERMNAAASRGSFYNTYIKGVYQFERKR